MLLIINRYHIKIIILISHTTSLEYKLRQGFAYFLWFPSPCVAFFLHLANSLSDQLSTGIYCRPITILHIFGYLQAILKVFFTDCHLFCADRDIDIREAMFIS